MVCRLRLLRGVPIVVLALGDTVFFGVVGSSGTCQFPTLGFVVDQHRKQARFVAEDFWRIQGKKILSSLCALQASNFSLLVLISIIGFINVPVWPLLASIWTAVTYRKDDVVVEFQWQRQRLFDHLLCILLCELCVDSPTATVTSVRGSERTKKRPVGLTTTELQKMASRRFRLSPADTLEIAEGLYQVSQWSLDMATEK